MLTSPANPLLKDVRRALARGGLTENGDLVAETFHLLEEALRSAINIRVALAAESVEAVVRERLRRVPAVRVSVVDDAVDLPGTEFTPQPDTGDGKRPLANHLRPELAPGRIVQKGAIVRNRMAPICGGGYPLHLTIGFSVEVNA